MTKAEQEGKTEEEFFLEVLASATAREPLPKKTKETERKEA